MNPATIKALTMMAIALPTMFAVILVFMGATTLLSKHSLHRPKKKRQKKTTTKIL